MRVFAFSRIIVLFSFLGFVLFITLKFQQDPNQLAETSTPPTATLVEDTSLASQFIDCTFPCWNGFWPGVTTLDEVHQRLPDMPVSISNEVTRGNQTVIAWHYHTETHKGVLVFESNTLKSIGIDPSADFTLEDILSTYGVPPAFSIRYDRGVEIRHALVQLNLYYPQQGLVFDLTVFSDNPPYPEEQYLLRGDSILENLMLYTSSDTIEEFIDVRHAYLPTSMSSVLTDWPGIGSILYPPCGIGFFISDIAAVEPTNTPIAGTVPQTPLTVTVNQSPNQKDPTSEGFVEFTVTFSRPVTCFDYFDISTDGSSEQLNLSMLVMGSGAEYSVYVYPSPPSGRVVMTIPAGVVEDEWGIGNLASISTDNEVTLTEPQ
jgi:hypothetical protein